MSIGTLLVILLLVSTIGALGAIGLRLVLRRPEAVYPHWED
jgi:hypothetical protein